MNRTLCALACAAFLLSLTTEVHAINRDCPRGKVWSPDAGACVKKKRVDEMPATAVAPLVAQLLGITLSN